MACVATLSRVEIDIFLSSASPGQQAIVRALRDPFVTERDKCSSRRRVDQVL
jgi:hypothetical protein